MTQWSATKAKQVLKALKNIVWTIKRQTDFQKKLIGLTPDTL